jgi:hypothetical protein
VVRLARELTDRGKAAGEEEICAMANFEKPLDLRDDYLSAASGLPIVPTVRTAALLAALLAYAAGFAILYPIAQASVSKSAAEGNDPTPTMFVAP